MGTSDTLRSVIDAGRSSKRLDELSSARVIGKIALQIHAAQQKAGAGKAVGPITPQHITLEASGAATLELGPTSSLGYSSPEQINGGLGDRRSDVFSLGTVLWEALTYQRLFDAMNDAAVRIAVLEREIQPPAEVNANVPAELSAICMRALSRNPTDRYQSLKSMAVEIEEFLEEAGYADTDESIATYLAALGEPKSVKITMPPLTRSAKPSEPPPVRTATASQPPPSLLGEPPQPVKPSSSGAALAAALANAATSPPLPPAGSAATSIGMAPGPAVEEWQDRPSEHPPVGATTVPIPMVMAAGSTEMRPEKGTISVAVPPPVNAIEAMHAEARPAAVIVETKPAVESHPAAVILDNEPAAPIVATQPGEVAPKPAAPIIEAKPVAEIVVSKPAADVVETKPGASSVEDMLAALGESPKPVAIPKIVDEPPVAKVEAVPAPAPASKSEPTAKPDAVPKPAAAAKSSPHPAHVVALGPIPAGRESKDLLGGWGWGTDKHTAIPPEDYVADDEFDVPPPNNRKTLLYIGGAGLAVMMIVVVIMFAFSGDSGDKKKLTAAAKREATSPEPAPPAAPEPAPSTPPTVDPAAAAPPAAPAPTEPTPAPTAVPPASAPPPPAAATPSPPATPPPSASATVPTPPAATPPPAAAAPATSPAKPEPPKPEPAKPEPAKQEPVKQEPKAIAKAEAPPKSAPKVIAKSEPKKKKVAKAEPKTGVPVDPYAEAKPMKAETPKTEAKPESKMDVETAYRQGLQLFARGDTTGALASLRTSLAGNPNYAPTWRGLGLVFEKMGEKDQARAAFKRYLQLAPSASDAEMIKGRLEKLGS